MQGIQNRPSILYNSRKIKMRQPHKLKAKWPDSYPRSRTLKTKKDWAVVRMEPRKMLDRGFRIASLPRLVSKTSIESNLNKMG